MVLGFGFNVDGCVHCMGFREHIGDARRNFHLYIPQNLFCVRLVWSSILRFATFGVTSSGEQKVDRNTKVLITHF